MYVKKTVGHRLQLINLVWPYFRGCPSFLDLRFQCKRYSPCINIIPLQHEHQRLEKRKEEDKVKIKQETAKKKATEQLKAMAEKRHKEKLKYKGITTLPASST